ncbi:MAG: hypothetical protein PUB42_04620 [Firmicutes bacterium]|nr:hypothetical protein [Bacillota bacterium]
MDSTYTKRLTYISLAILSLLIGFVFYFTQHLDYLIDMCALGNMRFSYICYCAVRIIESLLIPAVFIAPWHIEFGRVKAARITFIAYGIFQLLSLAWIFPLVFNHSAGALFSKSQIEDFLFYSDNLYPPCVLTWDTYGCGSWIYTIISAVLSIYIGKNFDDDRVKVRLLILSLFGIKLMFPAFSNLIAGKQILSSLWIVNNYGNILSFALLFTAIFIVSLSDQTWMECIWDQNAAEQIQDSDDETTEAEFMQ